MRRWNAAWNALYRLLPKGKRRQLICGYCGQLLRAGATVPENVGYGAVTPPQAVLQTPLVKVAPSTGAPKLSTLAGFILSYTPAELRPSTNRVPWLPTYARSIAMFWLNCRCNDTDQF